VRQLATQFFVERPRVLAGAAVVSAFVVAEIFLRIAAAVRSRRP
jgi:hypothetical protein